MSDFFRPQKVEVVSGPPPASDVLSAIELLCRFQGRANRADYIVGLLLLVLGAVASFGGATFLIRWHPWFGSSVAMLSIGCTIWMMVNLAAKRLRDCGLPAGLAFAVVLVPLLVDLLTWGSAVPVLVHLTFVAVVVIPASRAPSRPAGQ